ncbi:MAG: hypothetical protein R3B69_00775 [Candidatus Paceibacterota bacterium]
MIWTILIGQSISKRPNGAESGAQRVEIDFKLSTGDTVRVFTTRPDTLFGATYMVLAPEHDLVQKSRPHHQLD